MKIGFLGKGGSGKSTLATAMVTALRGRGYKVLAVDADHNMDLSYNLGIEPDLFLGTEPDRIKEFAGVSSNESFRQAREVGESSGLTFSVFPPDDFTKQVALTITDDLSLIVAGPHTHQVRSGESCSHSLAAPLKVYLPLLKLKANEAVVVDERAGTDPVATGILSSLDLCVIVREQTPQSIRVAEQIKNELTLQGVEYLVVDNKLKGIEQDSESIIEKIFSHLGTKFAN